MNNPGCLKMWAFTDLCNIYWWFIFTDCFGRGVVHWVPMLLSCYYQQIVKIVKSLKWGNDLENEVKVNIQIFCANLFQIQVTVFELSRHMWTSHPSHTSILFSICSWVNKEMPSCCHRKSTSRLGDINFRWEIFKSVVVKTTKALFQYEHKPS